MYKMFSCSIHTHTYDDGSRLHDSIKLAKSFFSTNILRYFCYCTKRNSLVENVGKKMAPNCTRFIFFVAIYLSCRSGQYCRGKKRKIIKQTNMESRYSYNFKYIGVKREKVLWHLNHKKFMIKHYPDLSEKKGENIFSN